MTPTDTSYLEIALTQGQVTKVSAYRYEELVRFNWYALWYKLARRFYVVRNVYIGNGKYGLISMQRQILGLKYGEPTQGDHKNGDSLDNTDDNLRWADKNQQQHNARKRIDCASGFKGVSFHKATGKWRSQIRVYGKRYHLGVFSTKEEAYAAYCDAARYYFGDFARVA